MKSASDGYKSRKMGNLSYLHEQRHFLNYCHSITPHAQPHRPFPDPMYVPMYVCMYVCAYVCTYVRLPAHQKGCKRKRKEKKPHDQPAPLEIRFIGAA